jgi:Undecaprenyl-phosphate glucose phosphotransferase
MFVSDILTLFLAGVVPAVLYDGIGAGSIGHYVSVVGSSTIFFVFVSQWLNIYNPDHVFDWRWMFPRVFASLSVTLLGVIFMTIATKTTENYSRVWLLSWSLLSLVSISSLRMLVLASVEAKLARGAYLKRALIVCCGEGTLTEAQLALETRNRVRAAGIVTARELDQMPDLVPYIKTLKPEIVIFSLPWSHVEAAISRFSSLSHYALEVLILPDSGLCLQKAIRLRRCGSRTMLQIVEPPLAEFDCAFKRAEDLVVAGFALVLTMPLLLLVAAAIKLESRGPVLFKQARVGLDGDIIEVWKFRSMYTDDVDLHAARQTSKNDPRVTRVGRFIRRTSIDELPQFWNVLQGHMSVVGPRPHALKTTAEGEKLDTLVDGYAARHRVKPGVTGWAQINGARGELCSREQVKRRVDLDLYYIENWSLLFDLKIILMTIVRVVYDPHAY